ncbi:MAG: hypothetical protein ACK4GM_04830 [Tabrizicola sp.]
MPRRCFTGSGPIAGPYIWGKKVNLLSNCGASRTAEPRRPRPGGSPGGCSTRRDNDRIDRNRTEPAETQFAGASGRHLHGDLGSGWGGAVSVIALVAYNTMLFGLIGLLRGISAGVFGQFGLSLEWWVYSLIAIVLVGILGYRQVDLSARVVIVLVALEYLIVLIVDFAILGAGGAEGTGRAVNIPDFSALTSGSLTAAILFCLGSFIGIEATTIYGEEACDPARTIPRATYLSIQMIGPFFVFITWLMTAGTGADKLVETLGGLVGYLLAMRLKSADQGRFPRMGQSPG